RVRAQRDTLVRGLPGTVHVAFTPRGAARPGVKLARSPREPAMQEQTSPARRKGGMPLHWKMAIGFAAGLALGLAAHAAGGAGAGWVQSLTTWVTQPVGTLFLRL